MPYFVCGIVVAFLVVPGHEDDPRLIRGAKALSGEPRDVPPSLCDGGPRTLLDLETPEGYPRAQLLEDYRTQPAIVALGNNPELEELIGGDPAARLTGDVEAYVRAAADQALPSNALLTLDGHWLDVANPERRRHFNNYLDALPSDTLVVRVLYHG